jgi:hypothetical protein
MPFYFNCVLNEGDNECGRRPAFGVTYSVYNVMRRTKKMRDQHVGHKFLVLKSDFGGLDKKMNNMVV